MAKIIDRRKQAMGGASKRKLSQIKNIAVHYSATPTGNTSTFENYWKNSKKWVTGGYHEVVLTNGNVELNYDANVISNGVLNHNTSTYHICYVGDGQPTKAQRKTLIERITYNKKSLGIADKNIKGHREFSGASTQCPAVSVAGLVKETSGSDEPSKPAPSPASGRVESKVNGLRFYNKPSWEDRDVVGRVNKGIGFPTIVEKVKVGNGHQYKVKNSKGATYYITAASKYVKVIGSKPTTSKPKPKVLKVGQTVTLKKSASKFATGQSIASHAKGKKYKIIQVKSDRVLLDSIMSWVKKSDVK